MRKLLMTLCAVTALMAMTTPTTIYDMPVHQRAVQTNKADRLPINNGRYNCLIEILDLYRPCDMVLDYYREI